MALTFTTIEEAADSLRVHPRTILRMIHRGELNSARVGRQHRIPSTEIERLAGIPLSDDTEPITDSDRDASTNSDAEGK